MTNNVELHTIATVLEEEAYRLRVLADYEIHRSSFVSEVRDNASGHANIIGPARDDDDADIKLLRAIAEGNFDVPSIEGAEAPSKSYDYVAYYDRWLTLIVGTETFELAYRTEGMENDGHSFREWQTDHKPTADFVKAYPLTAEMLEESLDYRHPDHFKRPSVLGEIHGNTLEALVRQHLRERKAALIAEWAERHRAEAKDEGPSP